MLFRSFVRLLDWNELGSVLLFDEYLYSVNFFFLYNVLVVLFIGCMVYFLLNMKMVFVNIIVDV